MSMKITAPLMVLAFFFAQIVGTAASANEDLVKAVMGLTAIGIIANEIDKGNRAAVEAEREAELEAQRAAELAAERAAQAARNRAEAQNREREMASKMGFCMRQDSRLAGRAVFFDYECMQKQGFRLTSKY